MAGKEAAETNAECLAVNAILELFSEGVRRKEAGKERTGQKKRWQRRFLNRSEIRSVFILIYIIILYNKERFVRKERRDGTEIAEQVNGKRTARESCEGACKKEERKIARQEKSRHGAECRCGVCRERRENSKQSGEAKLKSGVMSAEGRNRDGELERDGFRSSQTKKRAERV